MPKLFIANVSKQNQLVYFRLDVTASGESLGSGIFRPATSSPIIPPGRQMQVGGELHMNQISSIINQLSHYGLVNEDEVTHARSRITYICQVDRPVSAEAIRVANDRNNGILVDIGRDRRQKAAIAANVAVDRQLQEQLEPQPPVREFDVSVEQEEQSEAGEKRIEEGYRVDATATPPEGAPRGGRRRRAA